MTNEKQANDLQHSRVYKSLVSADNKIEALQTSMSELVQASIEKAVTDKQPRDLLAVVQFHIDHKGGIKNARSVISTCLSRHVQNEDSKRFNGDLAGYRVAVKQSKDGLLSITTTKEGSQKKSQAKGKAEGKTGAKGKAEGKTGAKAKTTAKPTKTQVAKALGDKNITEPPESDGDATDLRLAVEIFIGNRSESSAEAVVTIMQVMLNEGMESKPVKVEDRKVG